MPSNPSAQQLARRQDRDRREVERMGMRAARTVGRDLRVAVLRAFRAGRDPEQALRTALESLEPLLLDAMTLGHLKGRRRALLTVSARLNGESGGARLSTAYEGAIENLRRQQRIDAAEVDRLRELYGSEVSNTVDVLGNALRGRVTKGMERITSESLHVREGVRELRREFEAAGVTPEHSYTLENLFRTQTQLAYAAGRENVMAEPDLDAIVWGYEYVTVGDDRVRPGHAAMDGVRLPKDDPFWDSSSPPNGFSCRCAKLEIFEGDANARPDRIRRPGPREIDGVTVEPEPDRGFSFNPGRAFRDDLPETDGRRPPRGEAARFLDRLDDDDREALDRWTRADEFYDSVRQADRGQRSDAAALASMRAFKRAVRKAPKHEGKAYRGVGNLPPELVQSLRPGNTFREPAIASASKNQARARDYILRNAAFTASVRDPSRNALFEIRTRRGRDISAASPVEADREVMIFKSHRFRIVSATPARARMQGTEIAYTRIVLEEID